MTRANENKEDKNLKKKREKYIKQRKKRQIIEARIIQSTRR